MIGMYVFRMDTKGFLKGLIDNDIKRAFLEAENKDFEYIMQEFEKHGIVCETLHAPFDNINHMYSENEEEAKEMQNRLFNSIDRCEKYNIPIVVTHLSSGRPMPEITPLAEKRFKEVFDYADKKGIKIALENLRYAENLIYFLDKYKNTGFCYDSGHQYCRATNNEFLEMYGDRLIALHLHDNRCLLDEDDHLLPFDGNIDFRKVAHQLAKTNFDGTIMFEIRRYPRLGDTLAYTDITDEEYFIKAKEVCLKFEQMVEEERKKLGK